MAHSAGGGLPSAGAEGQRAAVRPGPDPICPRCLVRPFDFYVPGSTGCPRCGHWLPFEEARDEGGVPEVRRPSSGPSRGTRRLRRLVEETRAAIKYARAVQVGWGVLRPEQALQAYSEDEAEFDPWHHEDEADFDEDDEVDEDDALSHMIARLFDHPAPSAAPSSGSRPASSAVEESGARFQNAADSAMAGRDFPRTVRGSVGRSLACSILADSAQAGRDFPRTVRGSVGRSLACSILADSAQAGRDFLRTVRGSVGRSLACSILAARERWASGPAYKMRRTDDEDTVRLVGNVLVHFQELAWLREGRPSIAS